MEIVKKGVPMIRVTKEGNIPQFRGHCGYCGCEFVCEKSDGRMACLDPTTKLFKHLAITCPNKSCGSDIEAYPLYESVSVKKYKNEI
jgi:hypothetical protein